MSIDERLRVVYRDERLLVVDKPSGMLVHRGWGQDEAGAGAPALQAARALAGQHVYPVHRLDRGTSGLLVFALDSEVARALHEAFEGGRVEKRYVALVRGVPPDDGVIDHPIPRREGGPRVDAVTEFRRIATAQRYSLVLATPRTGRLHQVRRHLKHLNHPVIGDVNYGRGELNRLFRTTYGLHRLALHALELRFRHPIDDRVLTLHAPLPEDLRAPLALLGMPLPESW